MATGSSPSRSPKLAESLFGGQAGVHLHTKSRRRRRDTAAASAPLPQMMRDQRAHPLAFFSRRLAPKRQFPGVEAGA